MRYLLDTNTIIRFLNGRAPNVRVHIAAIPVSDLAVSTIVIAELRYGAAKSVNPARAVAVQDQFLSLITPGIQGAGAWIVDHSSACA